MPKLPLHLKIPNIALEKYGTWLAFTGV